MPAITFQCYACNQVLQVDAANAGRKAKCSQCGTILTIPVVAADAGAEGMLAPLPSDPVPPAVPRAAPEDRAPPERFAEDDDRPRRRDYRDDDRPCRRDDWDDDRPRRRYAEDYDDYDEGRSAAPKWDRVRVGMLLTLIGLCVMAGAFGLTILGTLVSFASIGAWSVFMQLGTTVLLLGTIVAIVGHVFWLFVLSNKRGALGFAIAALSVAGVYVLVQMITLVQVFGGFWGAPLGIGLIAGLLRAAHFMMIALYLRALAQTLRDGRLERSAGLNIVLSGCLAGVDLFMSVLQFALFRLGGLAAVFTLLVGVFVIVVYIFTLLALYRGKQILDYQVRGADARRW